MDGRLAALFQDMCRASRRAQLAPLAKRMADIRSEFTAPGAISDSRLPMRLDDIAAHSFEGLASQSLSLAKRFAEELSIEWTASNALALRQLIAVEGEKDWSAIHEVLQNAANGTSGLVCYAFNAAKEHCARSIDQEVALLELGADCSRIPIADRLLADRYVTVGSGWKKAHEFLNGPNKDLATAVKEAVGSVETLARVVINDPSATLGDAIKVLRAGGRLKAPLLKGVEELWALRSTTPGVGHGSSDGELRSADAIYCFTLAEAALGILLSVDLDG